MKTAGHGCLSAVKTGPYFHYRIRNSHAQPALPDNRTYTTLKPAPKAGFLFSTECEKILSMALQQAEINAEKSCVKFLSIRPLEETNAVISKLCKKRAKTMKKCTGG